MLDSFSGQEGISQPFRFFLQMFSEVTTGNPASVKPHDLVGTSMTVRVSLSEAGLASNQAFVISLGFAIALSKKAKTTISPTTVLCIVPWFSFLNYATNCRIFQDKDAPTIIQEVVAAYGYTAMLRLELTKSYAKRDYCVNTAKPIRPF